MTYESKQKGEEGAAAVDRRSSAYSCVCILFGTNMVEQEGDISCLSESEMIALVLV